MHRTLLAASCVLTVLSACSQQHQAALVDNRNSYFGRNGWYAGGTAVPRYSDDNRAEQGAVAYKYKTETHTYGVDAAVSDVAVNDLPPPSTVGSKPAPVASATQSTAPFSKASSEPVATANAVATRPVVTEAKAAASSPQPVGGANMAFRWPAEGKVISRFGPKTNGLSNDGINIASTKGDPIWAAADGEVVYVGSDLEGYGNLLILRHRDGWMTSYAHAEEFLLGKGDAAAQGDVLGYVGTTGSVKTPQLHFSVREGKIPIDPESVLGQQVASANSRN